MSESPNANGEKEVLAIVTGANGALGKAYLEQLAATPHVHPVGIARNLDEAVPGVRYVTGVDLLKDNEIREALSAIQCKQAEKILLIHPVGKFKFEHQPTMEIDADIVLSNMGTMVNTVKAVVGSMRASSLVVCGFGSVSDKYNVPFWRSYTDAKNKVRDALSSLPGLLSRPDHRIVRSVMVNVSTTDTGNENALRPNADTQFWLKPQKIVSESLPFLLAESGPGYQEIDIIEHKPGFDPTEYYGNPDRIMEKWAREMGQINSQ